MGADSLAPEFIFPTFLHKPKVLDFNEKKASFVVRGLHKYISTLKYQLIVEFLCIYEPLSA